MIKSYFDTDFPLKIISCPRSYLLQNNSKIEFNIIIFVCTDKKRNDILKEQAVAE